MIVPGLHTTAVSLAVIADGSMNMRNLLVLLISVAAVVRVAWFFQFAWLSSRGTPRSQKLSKLRMDGRAPANMPRGDKFAANRYDVFKTLQVSSYTLGALAFAAWTVLATQPSLTQDDRFSLGMLSITVLATIGATVVCREGGAEGSRMGFETALAIASLALVAALITLIVGRFPHTVPTWLFVTGMALFVVRDVIETRIQMGITIKLFRPDTPP